MAEWQLPAELVLLITPLSQPLHARVAWRLPPLGVAIALAIRRSGPVHCSLFPVCLASRYGRALGLRNP